MKIDTICNFTGSCKKLEKMIRDDCTFLDFSNLSGTTGYCSEEAAFSIRNRLKDIQPAGIHYLDDGNHHYMTLFFIERIKEPFDLYVFDHHTDMQRPSLLPILSCGGWILTALNEIDLLENVCLIGPPAFEEDLSDEIKNRIIYLDETEANTGEFLLPGKKRIYISVDLDILSPDEFTSIWDQGSMTKERLNQWLSWLYENTNVTGCDICG